MSSEVGSLAISQVALVTKDLRKTIEMYYKMLGWGPWNVNVFEPPRHHHTMLHGKPVHFTMTCAETRVGPIEFEVIEPLEGPSIYKEFLEEKGEGLHHMACVRTSANIDETLAKLKDMGADILMEGMVGDSIRYYYLDTEPMLKMIFEAVRGGHSIAVKPDWTYPP